MSLPPQILRIKRKRLDEPVDALYIETQKIDTKRRHTEIDYFFRRLVDEPRFSPQQAANKLPQILATQPGDENKYERASHKEVEELVADSTRRNVTQDQISTPRRFHLSRTTVSGPPTPAALKKRRRSTADETHIAVFVEASRVAKMDARMPKMRKLESDEIPEPSAPSSARKRPGRTARISSKPVMDQVTTHQVDRVMYEAMEDHARELDNMKLSDANQLDKTCTVENDAMDISDEYVYDTYERYRKVVPNTTGGCEADRKSGSVPSAPAGLIGYLVITEEDQPLWESYYDTDANSSDENDWDSEQDDENAENFYGADYPEEEVDSADEFGREAYKYRRGSDDEQFGSDEDDSSDEDEHGNEEIKPWRKTRRSHPFASPVNHDDSDDEEEL